MGVSIATDSLGKLSKEKGDFLEFEAWIPFDDGAKQLLERSGKVWPNRSNKTC